jgi:subtilase family serine protease
MLSHTAPRACCERPAAVFGWAGESTLDIEWAYAVAPLAHVILVAVPPAENLGLQGFPNLMKAIDTLVAAEPAGTIFSQSLGISENTFGGGGMQQAARFDKTYLVASAQVPEELAGRRPRLHR